MSLSHDGTISIGAGNNIWSGATDEYNNRVVIVADESPAKIQLWDLSSFSQVGSDITSGLTSNTKSLVIVASGASAVTMSTGSTNAQLVELPGGYVTSISGLSNLYSPTGRKGQMGAYDPVNDVALFCSSTAKTINKVDMSGPTGSTLSVPFLANIDAVSIIFKGSGRWIVGTERGGIYEIDADGVVYKIMSVGGEYDPYHQASSNTPVNSDVYGLAYDNGILIAVTFEGILYKIDYETATVIYKTQLTAGNNLAISSSASGEALVGRNHSISNALDQTVYEVDFTCSNNCRVEDVFYAENHGEIIDIGINSTNGKVWVLQDDIVGGDDNIFVLTLTPRGSTTRTFTVQIGGEHVKCRLTLIDDTSSIKKIITDTYMQSPATYRVPTGKTVKEVVKYQDGSSAQWGYSEYST